MLLRSRFLNFPLPVSSPSLRPPRSLSIASRLKPTQISPPIARSASSSAAPIPSEIVRADLFVPPGVASPDEVTADMVLPGSNIVVGPYAGDAKIKQVEFVKSSARARDCPKDDRPEFAILGRSNVGKSSLINSLVRKKEFALTSKKPGGCLFSFSLNCTCFG